MNVKLLEIAKIIVIYMNIMENVILIVQEELVVLLRMNFFVKI